MERIEPEGDHVRVTLRITDDELKLPADANAAVVARSVATDRYVELTPVYLSGPRMEDGAVIPLDRTVTPVDFDQVLASVPSQSQALVANAAALDAWNDITPLARNEFICWVEDAKQQKTRERRIRRTQEELEDGQRRPCCWPGCKHRERNGR